MPNLFIIDLQAFFFRILFGVSVSTLELARLNVYATEFTRARAAAAQLFILIDRKSKINPHDAAGLRPVCQL